MIIDQFVVQPSISVSVVGLQIVGVVLIVFGVVLVIVSVSNRLIKLSYAADRINALFSVFKDTGNKYAWVLVGVLLLITGGIVVCAAQSTFSSSVVTIGDGYLNIESKAFTFEGLFGIRGNKNVTSEEITIAFVGQVGSGDFALHRHLGFDSGDTNIGIFTLGNGATAYIASTNSINLIIELKNGEYLIVGTPDTQALADSFAQNVHSLTPKQ
jgi:ethanolamine utilization microcompartment shell protein EutS